jgi:tripartite ATP-independent transporter DctP family solute receptor
MSPLTRLLAAAGLATLLAMPAMAAKIKIATNVADTSNWIAGAKRFKEVVERDSGGRHTVEIHANGVLSGRNDRVELEMAQAGAVEIIMKTTPWLAQLHPDFMVISMPWIFPDAAAAMAVMDGPVGERLNKHLQSRRLHALAWGSGSFFQLYGNKGPVKTPDDIKGVKIRTPGLNLYLDSWKAIGANPVAMNFAEVFSALQAGAIDGGISPVPLIYSSRFYEVSKHVSLVNFSFEAIGFIASDAFWSKLSEADRTLLRKAAAEGMAHQRKVADEEESDLVKKMQAAGVTVYTPTAAELGAFKAKLEPVLPGFRKQIGEDLVKQVESEVARLKKS